MEEKKHEITNQAHVLFDRFVQATTCKGTLKAFQELCDHLELKPKDYRSFYHKLKSKLNYWKAKALWAKLDKRGSHKDYKKGKACTNTKCLIIGAGPCGLRTAIDLSLLGAKVVVIEKRDAFSRNNVLHLWPFTIHDLRGLGAKKFYGKFCAGAIDHIRKLYQRNCSEFLQMCPYKNIQLLDLLLFEEIVPVYQILANSFHFPHRSAVSIFWAMICKASWNNSYLQK